MTVAYRRQNNNKQTNKNETKKQTKKASKKKASKKATTKKAKKKTQHGIFEKQEKPFQFAAKSVIMRFYT